MINYNPKKWFNFIFLITKADTFRRLLPLMLLVAAYCALISYLEIHYLNLESSKYIRNVNIVHGVLGFVISLLLVFRTNTAYDRWWEGRKLWGSLTNTSRNLAIMIVSMLPEEIHKRKFRQLIPTYAYALKNHIRENENYTEIDLELDLKSEHHLPNQLAAKMYQYINQLHVENKLTIAQFAALDDAIRQLTDICGACERIKNTPIPFTYSIFIKKFIFLFVATLPFGWVFSIGYFTVIGVVLTFYALTSLELIAEEIENPFGLDANDLPLDQICFNIRKHTSELLE